MIIASTHKEDFELTKSIDELQELLESSTYEERARHWLSMSINNISSIEEFDKAKQNLLANQLGIDGAVNPGQKEISRHIKRFTQQPA